MFDFDIIHLMKKAERIYLNLFNLLEDKIPFFALLGNATPDDWNKAEDHLFDYNKTLITLSSSSLVLSFTATQLKVILNRSLLETAWVFFVITLILAVILMFLKFIAKLADTVWTRLGQDGHRFNKPALHDPVVGMFFHSVQLIFLFSIIEFITFLVGIIFMLLSAWTIAGK